MISSRGDKEQAFVMVATFKWNAEMWVSIICKDHKEKQNICWVIQNKGSGDTRQAEKINK